MHSINLHNKVVGITLGKKAKSTGVPFFGAENTSRDKPKMGR